MSCSIAGCSLNTREELKENITIFPIPGNSIELLVSNVSASIHHLRKEELSIFLSLFITLQSI